MHKINLVVLMAANLVSACYAQEAPISTTQPIATASALPALTFNSATETYEEPDFCGQPASEEKVYQIENKDGTFGADSQVSFSAKDVRDFVCKILPVAIRMDRFVFRQRRYVEFLQAQAAPMTDEQTTWLNQLKANYGLPADAQYKDVLYVVDIAPIPMLLAQGALESSWGQSRFAVQGNNFFGIHGNPKTDQCIMSLSTPPICVHKYANVTAGVSDYISFLNKMASQDPFRDARSQAREKNGDVNVPLDPYAMADTMAKYSQIGPAYEQRVTNLMTQFGLSRFAFDETLMPPLAQQ